MRRLGVVAAVVLLSDVLVGCAGSSPANGEDTALPSPGASRTTTTKGLHLPLEDYFIAGRQQQSAVDGATDILVEECMKSYGISYRPLPPAYAGPETLVELRYANLDEELASRYGFKRPGQQRADEAVAQGERRAQQLPADQLAVLIGPAGAGPAPPAQASASYRGKALPERGCIGQARRSLAPDGSLRWMEDMKFVDDLENKPHTDSEKDPRVAKAIAAWSSCMNTAGHPYPADPYAPGNDPRFNTQAHPYTPAPGETETAVADTRCAKKTNLVGIWFSVEVAYQKTLIRENEPRLRQCKHARDTVLRKAAEVLRGASA
ncbi:hypothetical protein OG432_19820 [Streptomyces sp. NBC_00442]|uniref:hypothetical protein n=1 Tax=Streptomyces sp. NBC_00442 TaxID=2903651 RepID=UPI002E1E214E